MSENAQSLFVMQLARFKRSVRLIPTVLDAYENPETKVSAAVAIRVLSVALSLVQSLRNTVVLWQCANSESQPLRMFAGSGSPIVDAAIKAAVPPFMTDVGAVTDKLLDAIDALLKCEANAATRSARSSVKAVVVRLDQISKVCATHTADNESRGAVTTIHLTCWLLRETTGLLESALCGFNPDERLGLESLLQDLSPAFANTEVSRRFDSVVIPALEEMLGLLENSLPECLLVRLAD